MWGGHPSVRLWHAEIGVLYSFCDCSWRGYAESACFLPLACNRLLVGFSVVVALAVGALKRDRRLQVGAVAAAAGRVVSTEVTLMSPDCASSWQTRARTVGRAGVPVSTELLVI